MDRCTGQGTTADKSISTAASPLDSTFHPKVLSRSLTGITSPIPGMQPLTSQKVSSKNISKGFRGLLSWMRILPWCCFSGFQTERGRRAGERASCSSSPEGLRGHWYLGSACSEREEEHGRRRSQRHSLKLRAPLTPQGERVTRRNGEVSSSPNPSFIPPDHLRTSSAVLIAQFSENLRNVIFEGRRSG